MPKDNNLNILHTIKKKGFTLIELLVVMAIIGILIGVTIVGINLGFRGQRNDTRQRDLSALQALLTSYYGSNRKYPLISQLTASATDIQLASTNQGTPPSTMTLSQTGVTLNPAPNETKDACIGAISSKKASASTWDIAYGTDTNNQTYSLCATQEGADVFNVSAN